MTDLIERATKAIDLFDAICNIHDPSVSPHDRRVRAMAKVLEAAPSPSPAPGVVTEIRAKIEAEHVKVSGDDGYNYAAGQEYGLRQALIIVDATLASFSQSAKEQEGGE